MTYEDLTNPPTEAELLTTLRDSAAAKGAEPATWKERSLPSVMTAVLAYVLYLLYQLIRDFAKGASFDPEADPSFVYLHAKSQYDVDPLPASFARYAITLVCAAGQGPHTILPGAYRVGTTWGLGFSNRDSLVVPSGGSVANAVFVADEAAAEYNVALGQITVAQTPLAGLSFSVMSQIDSGTDAETPEEIIERCQLLWSGLGAGSSEFVANLALHVDTTLTKVKTRVDATVPGKMRILLGTDAAPASAPAVAAMQSKIGTLELFQAVDVTCEAATVFNISIIGTVTAYPGQLAAAQAAVNAAVAAWQKELFFGDSIPISDFWRRLFTSTTIKKVELSMANQYNVDKWLMTVLVNSLTYVEAAE